jgi:hypothetical protein
MRTIFRDRDRTRLHHRIDTLTPESPRRWGRMTPHEMLCHLTDAVESAFDAESEAPGTGALSRQPLKWLVLNLLPWPKGKMASPPRLTRRRPASWELDRAALHDALDRLAARGRTGRRRTSSGPCRGRRGARCCTPTSTTTCGSSTRSRPARAPRVGRVLRQ